MIVATPDKMIVAAHSAARRTYYGLSFTPQKPIKRAYEQRPEAVQQWIEQVYPAIERRAKAEGGEIHWGNETALVNTDVRGRSYPPCGKTPVTMAVGGTREKLSMMRGT